jgi:energy-coupling factor transport system ATP-binding protein
MTGIPAEVFRRVDELREIGLDVPLAASLAHRLRSRGIPLRGDVLTDADLREALSVLAPGGSRAETPGP